MRALLLTLILLVAATAATADDSFYIPPECEIIIDDFADGIKPGWKNKSFKGMTDYVWVKENTKSFVRATSSNAASGLIYQIEYDSSQYPYIIWNWQVDAVIASGDATSKAKDDYSARVYAVFPSFLFWKTTAINYIWANKLPQNTIIPSSYTDSSAMVSVESGPANTGRWITETRNIHEDYLRFFGRNPPKVGAIAIMTDTDNTGESTSASYGPIAICSRNPAKN